jgi:hypothetical protein
LFFYFGQLQGLESLVFFAAGLFSGPRVCAPHLVVLFLTTQHLALLFTLGLHDVHIVLLLGARSTTLPAVIITVAPKFVRTRE